MKPILSNEALADAGISIVVPVYNERQNLSPLVTEIVAVLLPLAVPFEVIVVDDGSTDGTSQQLVQLKKTQSQLRLIRHRQNAGQSTALVSGVRMAQYPWIVTLDGDGQNDPADIPSLLQQCHSESTIVLGYRVRREDSVLRQLSSRIGNGVRRWWLKDGCRDTGCSLKLFSRATFLQLPHFNHLHRFLPALFLRAGCQLIHVPVNHRPRLHGVSHYGVMNRLFVGLYDLIGVRWILRRPCVAEIDHEF